MGNFYIEVLDRAWDLTKTNYKTFMAKEDHSPQKISQTDLLNSTEGRPPLTIPV